MLAQTKLFMLMAGVDNVTEGVPQINHTKTDARNIRKKYMQEWVYTHNIPTLMKVHKSILIYVKKETWLLPKLYTNTKIFILQKKKKNISMGHHAFTCM
jgi:hypothetical protein